MDIYRLLMKNDFETINEMVKKRQISLDDVLNIVKEKNSCFSKKTILNIARKIKGFNESHIMDLGIIYKQQVLVTYTSRTATMIYLSAFLTNTNVPDALYDNYAEYSLMTNYPESIFHFITGLDGTSIPTSTDIILINGFVEMLTIRNLITIKQIIQFIETYYWSQKKDISTIVAEYIIKTGDLKKILDFADEIKEIQIKEIKSNHQVWEDLTNAVILLAHNKFKTIYKFAKNIENIPEDVMKTIVTYVASTKSPEFIYLFLSNVNLSVENIRILTAAIIGTENTDYIGYSVISLGRKGIVQKIKNNTNLSDEEKENQITEFKRIKSQLTTYLEQRNNLNFLNDYDEIFLKELEEKLLNSDDSIENPFAPTENEKTKTIRTMPNPDGNA